MAAFWRNEITLRKLRVLLEYLPQNSPTRWHITDDQPFSTADMLLWRATWALGSIANGLAGKNKNVFEKMPQFPWQRPKEAEQSRYGDFGNHSPEEVLDYLDSL